MAARTPAQLVPEAPAQDRSSSPRKGRLAIVTLVVGLVMAPPAVANHEGTPSGVSVVAAQSSVTIPASIKLTVSADRHLYGTGYAVSIVDEDKGITMGPCGQPCDLYGGTSWADNADPQPRHFHGELRGPNGGLVATSGQVTVDVRKHTWNVVSVVPNPASRVVPGSIQFVATLDHTTYGTPYSIYMYDEDTQTPPTTCNQYTCGRWFSRLWADNVNPKAAHVRVEVRNSSGDVASNTVLGFAQFRRFTFSPSLSFSTQTGAGGSVIHKATVTLASTDPSLYGTPYWIKIKRLDGSEVCSSPQVGCTATVSVGSTYRGVVEDSQGRNFGQSAAWTLTSDGPLQETVGGDLDLAALATALGSSDPCMRVAFAPNGTHVLGYTENDQTIACEEERALGKTTLQILRAIAATGSAGTAVLWWLRSDTQRPAPAPGTETTPDDATAPRPVPLPWLPDVSSVSQNLTLLNPVLPQDWADEIANQCLFLMARGGESGLSECWRLPIFASGDDVPEATNHDLEALAFHAPWVRLNYEFGDTKPGSGWQNCPDRQTGQHCDEYPFFATLQGGPNPVGGVTPHLKPIDATQNQSQGGKYSAFSASCLNRETGRPFLGIPLAPALHIPTLPLCNTSGP